MRRHPQGRVSCFQPYVSQFTQPGRPLSRDDMLPHVINRQRLHQIVGPNPPNGDRRSTS